MLAGGVEGGDLACFSVGVFASRLHGIHLIKSITANAVDFCGRDNPTKQRKASKRIAWMYLLFNSNLLSKEHELHA